MDLLGGLLLAVVVIASAAGQILLRHGASRWVTGRGTAAFLGSVLRSTAVPALLLVLGAPVLYWKALESVALSRAYAVMSLTGVLVQIGGRWILGEAPSRRIVAGALLCCAGIAVWGLG